MAFPCHVHFVFPTKTALRANSALASENKERKMMLRAGLMLACLNVARLDTPQKRHPPDCIVKGGDGHDLTCGSGARATCVLAQRYRFLAAAIEHRGDINQNAMIRSGEGLGKLVVTAEDIREGRPVFLKCSPPADGRGTVYCPSCPSYKFSGLIRSSVSLILLCALFIFHMIYATMFPGRSN